MTASLGSRGLFELLRRQAETGADKLGVVIDGRPLTFGEVLINAEKVAGFLYDIGIRQGDRVGLVMPTSDAWMYTFWGIQALGAVGVPLAPGEGSEDIANIFDITEVKACVTVSRFQANEFEVLFKTLRQRLPGLDHVVVDGAAAPDEFILDFRSVLDAPSSWRPEMTPTVAPDDLYMLMSTSGTTGVPKVIPKRHGPSVEYLSAYLDEYDISESEVFFSAMPPYHMLSLSFMLICMQRGTTAIYLCFFDPEEMLDIAARFKAATVLLSATNAKMMLGAPGFEHADLSSVGTFIFSGELLPDEVAREFYEKRPFRVMNIIGSTEVSAYLVWDSNRDKGHSVSALTPLSCVETKLLHEDGRTCEEGARAEIFVTHGDILPGYYKNPEATSLAVVTSTTGKNWFRTGDLAIPRSDGRYQFAGRQKRIVKKGAVLIYPEEVECFLMTHPDITAAAIVKETDQVAGETMKAFVELRKGCSLSVIEIVRFCQGRLAAVKIPDKIVIKDELPRETGKVQLKKLREA